MMYESKNAQDNYNFLTFWNYNVTMLFLICTHNKCFTFLIRVYDSPDTTANILQEAARRDIFFIQTCTAGETENLV